MSSFFRDYLYFGLGGSKYGNAYLNLIITFSAIGLWHGGAWNFIVYGLSHGAVVCLERFLRGRYKSWGLTSIVSNPIFPYFSGFVSLQFVAFSRVLFRSESLDGVLDFFMSMLSNRGGVYLVPWLGGFALVISIALHFTPRDWNGKVLVRLCGYPAVIQGCILSSIVLLLVAFSSGPVSFVYFQF